MRLFVAAVPPAEVVEHLDDFLSVRREAASYRWTDPAQWHLTLAFAEAVPERKLDDLGERLERAARKRRAFEVRLGGGGAFPHAGRARVLFARLGASRLARTVCAAPIPRRPPRPPEKRGPTPCCRWTRSNRVFW